MATELFILFLMLLVLFLVFYILGFTSQDEEPQKTTYVYQTPVYYPTTWFGGLGRRWFGGWGGRRRRWGGH